MGELVGVKTVSSKSPVATEIILLLLQVVAVPEILHVSLVLAPFCLNVKANVLDAPGAVAVADIPPIVMLSVIF